MLRVIRSRFAVSRPALLVRPNQFFMAVSYWGSLVIERTAESDPMFPDPGTLHVGSILVVPPGMNDPITLRPRRRYQSFFRSPIVANPAISGKYLFVSFAGYQKSPLGTMQESMDFLGRLLMGADKVDEPPVTSGNVVVPIKDGNGTFEYDAENVEVEPLDPTDPGEEADDAEVLSYASDLS